MARPAKQVTHEQVRCMTTMLQMIKAQPAKEPRSKADIAAELGLPAKELADEYKWIEKRGWVARRTGPIPKGVYYKVTAKGSQAVKAFDLLYG